MSQEPAQPSPEQDLMTSSFHTARETDSPKLTMSETIIEHEVQKLIVDLLFQVE